MTLNPPTAQYRHGHDKGGTEHVVRQQKDGEVHSPPFLDDTGDGSLLVDGSRKTGALYQSRHNLPNGLRINFTVGHIDRMPRCEATGLIVPFCRHCDDLFHSFHDNPNSPEARHDHV